MMRIVLIRPGSTNFDEQRRIKGALNIPMSPVGDDQVARTVGELTELEIDAIYTAPCDSAQKTAERLARDQHLKVKQIEKLKNLDHGLWEGMLISEVKQKQPKVYRRCQDQPESVCPPEGESMREANDRIREVLSKIFRKHRRGVVALVVNEPLASLMKSLLNDTRFEDLWAAECDSGNWELLEIEPERLMAVR